jgi:phospholipid-transporting ATPase
MARSVKQFGYFLNRDSTHITVQLPEGRVESMRVLKVFDFTSERRAMSIVVIDEKTSKIYAFVKGADSSIMNMRDKTQDGPAIEALKQDIKEFASKGLRTLAFGFKEVPLQSNESVEFLLKNGWDRLTIEDVESNMNLLGATGVEDLLAENVNEHITDFRDAGIRVWMLTGDQGITAREIGISCGIISLENNR